MLKSAIRHITKGLIGITVNRKLSIAKKGALYIDYLRIILLAFKAIFDPHLTNPSVKKLFYINSFKLKIIYPNIYSFLFMFNEIFCEGEYPIIKNIKNYIDLGANIGLSTLWYYLYNPNMTAYLFEPDQINAYFLKINLENNFPKKYFLIQKAVSNTNGIKKFYRILDNIQNLDSGLKLNQRLPYEVFRVKTIKLSNFIKNIKNISLLKLDIEGEEYSVLKDLKESNSLHKIKAIVFESHFFNKLEVKKLQIILKWMKNLGELNSHPTSKYTSMNYWKNNNYINRLTKNNRSFV
jgi:FkbM family methyltransferase